MAKLYTVLVRWVTTKISSDLIDGAVTKVSMDWLRFDAWSWIVFSNYNALDITNAVRGVLHADDSVLVIEVNPSFYGGWAPQWVHDWILAKQQLLSQQSGLGGLSALSNALNLAPSPPGLFPPPPPPKK